MLKKRNWAFVFYPESLPTDWIDKLKFQGLPFAISPLHDKDLNITGEIKKAHYHVILCFPGPTTAKTVNALTDSLNQPHGEPIESVRGAYRYFTHKDNPDKYQYCDDDIQLFNGFDVSDVLNSSEVFSLLKELQSIILEYDFLEYSDLLDYLLSNDLSDLWNVASNHTLFLNSYITSRRHKLINSFKD